MLVFPPQKRLRVLALAACLLGAQLGPAAPAAQAAGRLPGLKIHLCQAALMSMRSEMGLVTEYVQKTGDAVSELRKFRVSELELPLARETYRPVRSRDAAAVARRIRGIEMSYERMGGDDGSERVYGYRIALDTIDPGADAREQITRYLGREELLAEAIAEINSGGGLGPFTEGLGTLIALSIYGGAGLALHPFLPDAGMKVLALVALGDVFLPLLGRVDWSFGGADRELRRALAAPPASRPAFLHQSANYRVDAGLLEKLWEQGRLNEDESRTFSYLQALPPILGELWQRVLDFRRGASDLQSYVLTDRLLRFDDAGNPELIVVLRTSKEEPAEPTVSIDWSKVLDSLKRKELAPIRQEQENPNAYPPGRRPEVRRRP